MRTKTVEQPSLLGESSDLGPTLSTFLPADAAEKQNRFWTGWHGHPSAKIIYGLLGLACWVTVLTFVAPYAELGGEIENRLFEIVRTRVYPNNAVLMRVYRSSVLWNQFQLLNALMALSITAVLLRRGNLTSRVFLAFSFALLIVAINAVTALFGNAQWNRGAFSSELMVHLFATVGLSILTVLYVIPWIQRRYHWSSNIALTLAGLVPLGVTLIWSLHILGITTRLQLDQRLGIFCLTPFALPLILALILRTALTTPDESNASVEPLTVREIFALTFSIAMGIAIVQYLISNNQGNQIHYAYRNYSRNLTLIVSQGILDSAITVAGMYILLTRDWRRKWLYALSSILIASGIQSGLVLRSYWLDYQSTILQREFILFMIVESVIVVIAIHLVIYAGIGWLRYCGWRLVRFERTAAAIAD